MTRMLEKDMFSGLILKQSIAINLGNLMGVVSHYSMRHAVALLMVQKFCFVLLVSYLISTDTQLPSIRSDEKKTLVSISKPATRVSCIINDDYMNSLYTLKGRRHCVLRESKTHFKAKDVYDPVMSVQVCYRFLHSILATVIFNRVHPIEHASVFNIKYTILLLFRRN
ncbi:hypothetical protein RF11_04360 [Thelohanellus kitauei]|uniref:Uncharacterized protein n=1 Tax=Thelohanellus kitauei TaxID=669202 RepID=A0A0C2N886_THEKT|nr:hypothetical protein RF11_04360 [Thelohanellus kitauei]